MRYVAPKCLEDFERLGRKLSVDEETAGIEFEKLVIMTIILLYSDLRACLVFALLNKKVNKVGISRKNRGEKRTNRDEKQLLTACTS